MENCEFFQISSAIMHVSLPDMTTCFLISNLYLLAFKSGEAKGKFI